jgi:hypothetical protein
VTPRAPPAWAAPPRPLLVSPFSFAGVPQPRARLPGLKIAITGPSSSLVVAGTAVRNFHENDALLALAAFAAHRSALLRPHPQKERNLGGHPPGPPSASALSFGDAQDMPRRCARWNGVILLGTLVRGAPPGACLPQRREKAFSWLFTG